MSGLQIREIFENGVILEPTRGNRGVWNSLRRSPVIDLRNPLQEDKDLSFALARIRTLDHSGKETVIRPDSLTLSHSIVAKIEDVFAPALGLPKLEDQLTFATKFLGTLGSSDARLEWHWERLGKPEMVPRRGAFLFPDTPGSRRRIPATILQAIELSETFDPTSPLPAHWRALAAFRDCLGSAGKRASPDRFLSDLRITSVARIGIEVDAQDEAAFIAVPVGAKEKIGETDEPLFSKAVRKSFSDAVADRGALPAYRLSDGTFAVVDQSAAPVLELVAKAMRGDRSQRKAFIQDAPRLIEEALEHHFRETGQINEDTTPEQSAELITTALEDGWAETNGWSERVIGIGAVARLEMEISVGSGLPWLPDTLEQSLGELLGSIADDRLEVAIQALQRAVLDGEESIEFDEVIIPVHPDVVEALRRRLAMRSDATEVSSEPDEAILPLVHANLHDLDYFAHKSPRGRAEEGLPSSVKSVLRPYQLKAFDWQQAAWTKGMPGLLNADEQGLGKTLQTLSFLAWLTQEMRNGKVAPRPVLVVAPTSLLRNWQDEIEQHLDAGALGPIHRMYGTELSKFRGTRGRDIVDGETHLDLLDLVGKVGVVVTTYQTLANYAVSLNQLHFGASVFDEIQFIKNPRTQRTTAVKGVNSDFHIGLTGTPIENRTQDLWSIVDTIAPGSLGALAGFNRIFEKPDGARLEQLRTALFDSAGGGTPLCLRRTKEEADPSIPPKVRLLYSRDMPRPQMLRYDEARAKGGGILQVLQHIRRVSAHPGMLEGELTNDFIGASARSEATLDILRYIASKGERALVFVENLDLQAWLAEFLKIEFDLPEVMVINGGTSINDRREITRRFQRHLKEDEGFDVLLLGPRAAGTGLTLTAANHVIHLTRWWNPAVEEQCNDRTHRIGQTKQVTIHLPMAIHPALGPASFDCLLHRLISGKRALASNVMQPSHVSEGDLRLLHNAVISGEITDDLPKSNAEINLPDRDDLSVENLGENVIQISGIRWSGKVLVGFGKAINDLAKYRTEDTLCAIMVSPEAIGWDSNIPLSKITDERLWPDLALPF